MSIAKAEKLRVVLDTNVYISAFTHPLGAPFRMWRAALQQRYALLTSPAIVAEVGEVLRLQFAWEDAQLIPRMKILVKVAEIVVPKMSLSVVAADDDDNRILECALGGKADLVVSGDHHLRDLKSFQGIGIVRPIDFCRTMQL